jgi:hypothetical protein
MANTALSHGCDDHPKMDFDCLDCQDEFIKNQRAPELYTALIVPAFSDMAGKCNIVARKGDINDALRNYREDPRQWHEVGIMNSRGELVCCDKLGNLRTELKECEPLMAGLVLVVDANADE